MDWGHVIFVNKSVKGVCSLLSGDSMLLSDADAARDQDCFIGGLST